MLRQLYILFILIVSAGVPVWGQSGSSLYVASPKGLSLRESATKESKRIQLLPYGTIIPHYNIPEGKTITIDGYTGKWISVPTNEGKNGYIFDGYTLPFEAPSGEDILKYFSRVFGTITSTDSIVKKSDSDDYNVIYTYTFSSGVVFTDASYYEAYECILENVDLSVQKAYLFYFLLEEKVYNTAHLRDKIDYPIKPFTSDSFNIQFNQKDIGDLVIDYTYGATTYLIITAKGAKTTITWGSGL